MSWRGDARIAFYVRMLVARIILYPLDGWQSQLPLVCCVVLCCVSVIAFVFVFVYFLCVCVCKCTSCWLGWLVHLYIANILHSIPSIVMFVFVLVA